MSKNSITKDKVFAAAIKIAGTGSMPTTVGLRQELGKGSDSTLHKYLQEWKSLLLKNAGRIGQDGNLSLLNENNILRQNIEELMQSLSNYTAQLQNLEQANAKVAQENVYLLQENTQQKIEIAGLQAQVINLRATIEHNSSEYQKVLDKIIAEKNHIIQFLQEEMRLTQVDAIEKIRDYSFKEHDMLIQERVKITNLQAEVIRLRSIVAKIKDPGLLVVEEEIQPMGGNNRAQLLSELYAQKMQSYLQVGDEIDANNN